MAIRLTWKVPSLKPYIDWLRFGHPKSIEAMGVALLLLAAMWSFLVVERIDSAFKKNEAELQRLQLLSIEQLIVVPDRMKQNNVVGDMYIFESAFSSLDKARSSVYYQQTFWIRIFLYVVGSVLVIWAKLREARK